MAQDDERGEKTEEATQQRREEFRRRGQVAHTRELSAVLMLVGSILTMVLLGQFFMTQLRETMTLSLTDFFVSAARTGEWRAAFSFAAWKILILIAPVLGIFFLFGASATVLQTGFLNNEEALQFKPERLDPIQGLKRIFSLKSWVEGLKAVLKMVVISWVVYLVLRGQAAFLPHLVQVSLEQSLQFVGDLVLRLFSGVAAVMVVLAGLDFLFQRWDLEKEMMMTRQELREEIKSREGDPLVRARIKRVQREMANRRMMDEVPKADVIVTNPTHIACALKYDDTMVAPRLIAKGADLMAERIKALAREHNVPVIENKPLARTIFKTLKIGQAIPRELYTAVAEVLAFVYRLKRKVT